MPEHWKLQTNKMLKQKNALLNPKYLRNGHTFHSNPFFVKKVLLLFQNAFGSNCYFGKVAVLYASKLLW